MKRVILLLAVVFVASVARAQDVFKLGIVKGKHVTYEVTKKRSGLWTVTNIHNPDTTTRRGDKLLPGRKELILNCELQLGQIVREHLTREELLELSKPKWAREIFWVELRGDWSSGEVLQVVNFEFENRYDFCLRIPRERRCEGLHYPDHYDGFWLNFDPDRLHGIEQDVVKRLKVPKMTEKELEAFQGRDLTVSLECGEISNIEQAIKEKRKSYEQDRKEWREFEKRCKKEWKREEKRK
ncbi:MULTISPECIES: hypothetical protein [Butyricimonas]|uniref:hypothetical protein n=1 Tax=Butyricimonas TaxID=574697 RepID=UPI0007FB5382|nr:MULTISPECIES: hypothetical protein [Butyricimonas]